MEKRITVKKDSFRKTWVENIPSYWTKVYEGTKKKCFQIIVPAYKKVGYEYIDYGDYEMKLERQKIKLGGW